jgi:ABC-type transporter Mla subunit MlaD
MISFMSIASLGACTTNNKLIAILDMRNNIHIKDGSSLVLNGVPVGSVSNIRPRDSSTFLADITISQKYCIPKSAEFTLQKIGIISDEAIISVKYASSGNCLTSGDTVIVPQRIMPSKIPVTDSTIIRTVDSLAKGLKRVIRREQGR